MLLPGLILRVFTSSAPKRSGWRVSAGLRAGFCFCGEERNAKAERDLVSEEFQFNSVERHLLFSASLRKCIQITARSLLCSVHSGGGVGGRVKCPEPNGNAESWSSGGDF